VPLLQKVKFAKFDETVESHFVWALIRSMLIRWFAAQWVLPHGLGKSKKSWSLPAERKSAKPRRPEPTLWAVRRWFEKNPERGLDGF